METRMDGMWALSQIRSVTADEPWLGNMKSISTQQCSLATGIYKNAEKPNTQQRLILASEICLSGQWP